MWNTVSPRMHSGRRVTQSVNVGIVSAGSIVKGEYGTLVQIDKPVRDVATDDFDALFIPGTPPTNFVSMTTRSGSPGISSRRKSRYLQSATRHSSLSRPRYWRAARVTGWKSLVQDIKNAGAEYVDEEVVVDGNLV